MTRINVDTEHLVAQFRISEVPAIIQKLQERYDQMMAIAAMITDDELNDSFVRSARIIKDKFSLSLTDAADVVRLARSMIRGQNM